MEARVGAQLLVHAEAAVLFDQRRDIAVGVGEVAEMQCVGDAGIDAGRGRLRIDAGHQAMGEAVIDAVGTEGAFLGDAEARRVLAGRLAPHAPVAAVGEPRFVDLVAGLVGTRHGAVGTADAELVVDGDDAVGPLPGRRRRTDVHAGRVGAMHAADRHEGAADVGVFADLEIEDAAPLHGGRRRVGVFAGGRAGLAADAAPEIGDHAPAGHRRFSRSVTRALTRSEPEPVESVRSSSIGVSLFMLGTSKVLASGVTV